MVANTSATGGTLSPATPYQPEDDGLDNIFQQLITAITGLDPTLVRPRWQVVPQKIPDPNVDWCSIGVLSSVQDDGPYVGYNATTNTGPYFRHETLHVLASFYGPHSGGHAAVLRDGIAVPQNTEFLNQFAMRYRKCGAMRTLPELFNQQWIRRHDFDLTFARKITRSYAIDYLAIAEIHVIDDTGAVNETVVVPPDSPLEP